jgi:hypothetical protein
MNLLLAALYGPSNASVSRYESETLAAQMRASPRLTGLVHYASGWLPGGINFTGCGLRLVHGVTVAGRVGTAAETTCPACLEARR